MTTAPTLYPTRHRAIAMVVFACIGLLVCTTSAFAQRVTVSASSDIYAGLPFVLNVSAEGFDEDPVPTITEFEIPGCDVEFIEMRPNVSTSISIFGGRRTEQREVEFVFRYRVSAKKSGTYTVPAIKATQGQKHASTRQANFRVKNIATTGDMQVQMTLPDRPVIVGETFQVILDWFLRKNPDDPEFIVPLFNEVEWVDVHQPRLAPIRRTKALTFPSGDREISLPYTTENTRLNGAEYTRFRFVADVTPIKAGTLQVAPTRVIARLPYGRRSSGLFSTQPMRMFKAEDSARTLEILPLPLKDRPSSFSNAVGTAFSIQVTAERTVVRLGDPVKLSILIRGDGRLEGLSLPKLDTPEGLPVTHFSIGDAPATGEIIDLETDADGNTKKGKRFKITARVTNPNVKEIPPIAFSYYNPTSKQYDTIRSEPIALSVEGSNVIGTKDVVSTVKKPDSDGGGGAGSTVPILGSLVGADLSLSSLAHSQTTPWALSDFKMLLYALYALPLFMFGFRLWQLSTRKSRGEKSEVKKAAKGVHEALSRAQTLPAREAGPPLLSALRALARSVGRDSLRGEDVIERIETECYNPAAAEKPLDKDIVQTARELVERLANEADNRRRASGKSATAIALTLSIIVCGTTASSIAHAQTAGAVTLDAARAAYQQALSVRDRDARTAAFARAELLFRQLVEQSPDSPELITDWGNAALGAQDIGRATLAYRRATALHPRQTRAKRNLSWVRERQPDWLPKPDADTTSDSLFFWHHSLSLTERHLIAALAFAATILLIVPWGRRRRLLRRLALLPAAIWIGMIASVLLDSPPLDDAVVVQDDVAVLSADSLGAPPALPKPLPAGAEITVIESRERWSHIALSNGIKGWVQTSAIAHVVPES